MVGGKNLTCIDTAIPRSAARSHTIRCDLVEGPNELSLK